MKSCRRIGITGSICTGEAEIIDELSRLTGIPKLEVNNEKWGINFNQFSNNSKKYSCSKLFEISLKSFLNEVRTQSKITEGDFFHNCSFLQKYIASTLCLEYPFRLCTINGDLIKLITGRKSIIGNYEILNKCITEYMQDTLDSIIHLPVEVPLPKTKINSFPNEVRKMFDKKVISFIQASGIEHYVITGSVEEKLQKIQKIYGF